MKPVLQLAAKSLLALAIASPSAAASPRVPAGKWVVDFADHQCVASRNYGTVDKPLYLGFKPSPLGKVMQIVLALKSVFHEPTEASVAVQIDDLPPISASLLSFSSKASGLRSIRINLPLESFAPMRQAKKVSIVSKGESNESLVLTQMPLLMIQIDRCLADLQQHWNINEDARAKLRSRARSVKSLAGYFSDDDYPAMAVRKEETGTVEIALLIDETGKVADCTVTATSNVAALDAQSCALLTARAKFVPAVGADGKPAKDAFLNRIRWVMPD